MSRAATGWRVPTSGMHAVARREILVSVGLAHADTAAVAPAPAA